ncbi:MAG: glycosyl transferase, partial [Holosporales bacterium]
MRILQVLPALEAGGVTSGTLEIARALVDRGDEAHVFSAPGDRVAALQKSGAIHHIAGEARKSCRNYHA